MTMVFHGGAVASVMVGDCRASIRSLAPGSVNCCVTSPPYFGLRDYGVAGQIGLEQTPEEYIAAMVEVFRCVRNVLADDGTVWVNIGDSYAAQRGGTHQPALIEPCILAGCPVGGVVLDPFGGSGTTAGVALQHGRNAVLCELNPEYAALVPDRVKSIIGK